METQLREPNLSFDSSVPKKAIINPNFLPKMKHLILLCLFSFGLYGQETLSDTLYYYAGQYESGAITLEEFNNSVSGYLSTLPESEQYTRYHKEFERGMAFWRNRMHYSTTGDEKPGFYSIALRDYLQSPICPNGDKANWKFAFDPNPISDHPTTLGFCTEPGAHAAGIIFSVYMNPADTSIILAGSNTAGIWRSTDGGANWTSVTDDLRIPTLAIREIIDISKPSEPEGKVLLAVTGRDQFNDSYGVGVLKSTDFGATWTQYSLPLLGDGTMPVLRQVTKPYSESNLIFACSREKVYESSDLGETWAEMTTAPTLSGNTRFYGLSSTSGTEDMIYLSSNNTTAAQIWRKNVSSISWEEITDSVVVAAQTCHFQTVSETFDFDVGLGILDSNTFLDTAAAGPGDDTLYEITLVDIGGDQHVSVPSLTIPGGVLGGVGGLHLVYDLGLFPPTDSLRFSCNAAIPEGAQIEFYVVDAGAASYIDPGDELALTGGWDVGNFGYVDGTMISYDQTFPAPHTDAISHLVIRFNFAYPYPYGGTTPILFDDFSFEFKWKGGEISPSAIGISEGNGDQLYAIVQAMDSTSSKFRSTIVESNDKGVNWTCRAVGSGTNTHESGDILAATDNFTAGFGAEEAFYWGGVRLIRYDETEEDYYEFCSQHDDIRDIQIIKNVDGNNHLLVGDDGGVAYSKDNGLTWESLNGSGLPITQFYSIALNPHDNKTILGGTQDNGTFHGNSDGWSIVGGGDGNGSAFAPDDPDRYVYQVNARTYHVDISGDDPDTIYTNVPGTSDYLAYLGRPLEISPVGNSLFEGLERGDTLNGAGILKHDADPTGGFSTPVLYEFGTPSRVINAIGIAPSNQNYVYASDGSNRSALEVKKFFRSSDHGVTYTDMSAASIYSIVDENGDSTGQKLQDILGFKHITTIEVKPTHSQQLWIGISGIYVESEEVVSDKYRVLYSPDGGLHWEDYSVGLPPFPVNDIIYQAETNDRLFAATDAGIYYRDASMDSWECFSEGMPITLAMDLEINYCSQELYAGTFGRGIWKTSINLPDSQPVEIDEDLTWSGVQQFDHDILIKSGNTLTITGTVEMAGTKKIKIEPGAELVLDGGTITNTCEAFWGGIEVWGNSTAQQTAANQGKLRLFNNAVIENAFIGVTLWEAGNFLGTGGIIYAANSTFKNNKKDVEFTTYQNTNGSGDPIPNVSYFTNVTFTWNDDFLSEFPLGHVTLYKVDGVRFKGCTFSDDRTAPPSRYYTDYSVNNSGIRSIDAQYFVVPGCSDYISGCSGSLPDDPDWQPTTFNNLDFGIYASNATTEYNITVDRAEFNNNLYGVQTVGINNPVITRNQFDVNNAPTNNFTAYTQRGIHAVKSQGLTIEENNFTHLSGLNEVQGIICSNLGETEERLYKNYFRELDYGVVTQGKNRGVTDIGDPLGLQFLCDSNFSNQQDHLVLGTLWGWGDPVYGVKSMNGSPDEASGNIFSDTIPTETGEHYDNQSTNLIRYFYLNGDDAETPLDLLGDIEDIGTDDENTCPTELSDNSFQGYASGFLTTIQSDFNTYVADLDSALTEYDTLVNGGNTAYLMSEIDGLTRQNRDTLHALLLSHSPYLTVDVVKATVDHPVTKYPHAWSYELVEENIEVAYEPGFIDFLRNKTYPLPELMIDDIEALLDSNAYTDMLTKQGTIADLQAKKARAANILIQSLKNDTTGIDADSLRHWISEKDDPLAATRIIDAYLQKEDYMSASTALNTLNTSIQTYPSHLQDELTDYVSFKDKLIDLLSAGTPLDSLSQADYSFMEDMAENGVGLAQYQSQEILCFFYDQCAEYPITIGSGQQTLAPVQPQTDFSTPLEARSFKVYPNPANTWIAIELPIVEDDLLITVVDLTGRLVYTKAINGNANTSRSALIEIWDTALIGEGVYLITITNSNTAESYGTERIIIHR